MNSNNPPLPERDALTSLDAVMRALEPRAVFFVSREAASAVLQAVASLADDRAAGQGVGLNGGEHGEELSEAKIGAACYRGNTVSFMYDKARAYGNALTDTWDVLKEFGHQCDGETALKDKLREIFAAQPEPIAAAPVRSLAGYDLAENLENAKGWAASYNPLKSVAQLARVNPNFLVALIEHALATTASEVPADRAAPWADCDTVLTELRKRAAGTKDKQESLLAAARLRGVLFPENVAAPEAPTQPGEVHL